MRTCTTSKVQNLGLLLVEKLGVSLGDRLDRLVSELPPLGVNIVCLRASIEVSFVRCLKVVAFAWSLSYVVVMMLAVVVMLVVVVVMPAAYARS